MISIFLLETGCMLVDGFDPVGDFASLLVSAPVGRSSNGRAPASGLLFCFLLMLIMAWCPVYVRARKGPAGVCLDVVLAVDSSSLFRLSVDFRFV